MIWVPDYIWELTLSFEFYTDLFKGLRQPSILIPKEGVGWREGFMFGWDSMEPGI